MKNAVDIVSFLNSAWSIFIVILGIAIFLYTKITSYMKLTKEQKIEAGLKVVKSELLKLMSDAEIQWKDFEGSGELKKSQVITEIYNKFPFLTQYISQEELIEKISDMIEEKMDDMNGIINNISADDIKNLVNKNKNEE